MAPRAVHVFWRITISTMTSDQRYISQIGGEPTVTGILRNWNWRDIETSRGVYDFSSIDTYLKTGYISFV